MQFEIHGNIEGVRDSVLAEMKTLYEYPIEQDEFAPVELVSLMAKYSASLDREVALYVSRDGDVMDIVIGSATNVPLQSLRLRRSTRRLSCIRCLHTHPQADAQLSDVDYSALKSLMLDAMCAIGVDANGHVNSVSAAFLGDMDGDQLTCVTTPFYSLKKLPQAEWMREIELADERAQKTLHTATEDAPERVLLVGTDNEKSLDELAALADTAGAVVVGREMQKRQRPDPATYIGSGKADELQLTAQSLDVDAVIFDDELSGVQTRNLEQIIGVKIIDRTTLILDIFAQRAKSGEGKLQVKLAQLKYRSGRLIGQGLVLSRLAGGIGTRGPGESKLEIDRRRIREQITALKRELDALQSQRELRRKSREQSAIPVVALVGYTNTGKSSLLNRVTDAGVYAHNQLFATLDAVSRHVKTEDGAEFLLVDTVGFISKLPHALIEAFHSTLEEAACADLLLIVSDASNEDLLEQRKVVGEVLDELGATTQERIDVLNKADVALPSVSEMMPGAVMVSAKTGEGIAELLSLVSEKLRREEHLMTLHIPFSSYNMIGEVRSRTRVLAENHLDDGTALEVLMTAEALGYLQQKFGRDFFAEICNKIPS